MRVDNQNINGLGGSGSFGSVGPLGRETGTHSPSSEGNQTDIVNLSGASNLITIARNSIPTDRVSKIAGLAAQVRSGSYQANLADTSRSMVEEFSGS